MPGLGLFFILIILIPISLLLTIGWVGGKNRVYGIILGIIWSGLFVLILASVIGQKINAKKILEKEDYYGQYVIDRNHYAGKQPDWQYNNFRFEIKDNDSIYFYVINKDEILKTFKGIITTSQTYTSKVLVIHMTQPTIHILASNPTTYRNAWNFYLVFNSPKFGNMFFKKGKWEEIEN